MGISGRTAKTFLQSPITPLIALIAALLGVCALLFTPREEEPQINVTMANVFIPFPGASAKDVETLLATRAEQVLAQIAGIEHVYSVSRPGLAMVTVQFKVGEDRTQALVRLYDTLMSNRNWVAPELGVGEFLVKPVGIDDVPVVTLTFWTQDAARGAHDLQQIANAAEIELKRVPGTRTVTTVGGATRMVRVLFDPERLNAYRLTAQDVRAQLIAASSASPSGVLTRENVDVVVETGKFFSSGEEVAHLVIGSFDGAPVYVSDVARIEDGPEQPNRYVWFGTGPAAPTGNAVAAGEFPAVTIAISKKPGENAVSVAQQIMRRVDQLQGSLIPEGVNVSVTRNYGETADDKARKLTQKLIFATLSVIALVWATLGWREALIVGSAVLLTLAATLFASWVWGFTLNRVSLFALIFSIGILVDDAIVVVENIHRRRALSNQPAAEVIPHAVDEVGGPTILATFTVIAALLPMAFVSGLMGPYMSPIPINASMGMLISLAIAFVITPWLALKLLRQTPGHDNERANGLSWLQRLFALSMTPFLRGKKGRLWRWLLWLVILLLIVIALSLAMFRLVVLKMLPFDNKSEFQIVLDMPVGTPLEATAGALREIGAYLATIPEVTDYQAYVGTAAPINFNGLVRQYALRAAPELGDLQVNLTGKHLRRRKSHEIAAAVRPAVALIARRLGGVVKVVEVPPGPPVLAPIVAEVYGPDYSGQISVAKRVRASFAATADIVDIDDSVEEDAPKVLLRVDHSKAALLGVAKNDIVDAVRLALNGENVTPLHTGSGKYEVPVRLGLAPETLSRIDAVLKMNIRAKDGALIPLSELVEPVQALRDKVIYHKDLLPVVYVVADMAGKLDSPLYGMFAVRSQIAGAKLAEGGALEEYLIHQPDDRYRQYAYKWDGEWQVTYETFRDMGIAYGVGLILIYLLVVAEFKSFLTPLIIMAPIPLTIIGVMPGHAILGAQYTATSMIGMIALAGIIVRNSILLVDFINLQVREGMPFQRAVISAAATRAKPIVLTGAAAMLGALFILDDPIFNGLAISLLFGIFVSTLLTLIVIPVLYYVANWRRLEQSANDLKPEPLPQDV
jgi:multidrug efflux pump subunit AcrB